MNDVIFSVITTTYNINNKFQTCLKSLHNQSFKNAEFIVIDDDSTDGTWGGYQ